MDNQKMPPVQQPSMSYTPPAPEQAAANVIMDQRNKTSDLIKTVVAVVFGVMSLVFLGLFVYFMTQYNILQDDLDTRVDEAVAEAKETQAKLKSSE